MDNFNINYYEHGLQKIKIKMFNVKELKNKTNTNGTFDFLKKKFLKTKESISYRNNKKIKIFNLMNDTMNTIYKGLLDEIDEIIEKMLYISDFNIEKRIDLKDYKHIDDIIRITKFDNYFIVQTLNLIKAKIEEIMFNNMKNQQYYKIFLDFYKNKKKSKKNEFKKNY